MLIAHDNMAKYINSVKYHNMMKYFNINIMV